MGSPDATASMIQQVRRSMLAGSAIEAQLDAVGNNYGVPRPDNTDDDELYRRLIKALAWLPKGLPLSYHALLTAVFGSQAQAILQVGRAWKIYEVNPNEVVVELPAGLITGGLELAAYLHGASGFGQVPSGPSDTFTTDFDLQLSRATTVVGSTLHFQTSRVSWTTYTIATYSFSGGVATVQVSASTLPTGGGLFYLEVPGDGTASYRGDYVATGGIVTTYSTEAGVGDTNVLHARGNVTGSVLGGMPIRIGINGALTSRTVGSVSGYNITTNTTPMTITTADVPRGQTDQAFILAQESADTATTPPHSDRVYLTGTGLYQVVEFYLNLLVRAAGVRVRIEII